MSKVCSICIFLSLYKSYQVAANLMKQKLIHRLMLSFGARLAPVWEKKEKGILPLQGLPQASAALPLAL